MFFGYNGVNRNVINAFFVILIIWSFLGMSRGEWLYLLLTLPAVIIAITFHEFAHAKMADKLGDSTPRSQGRITLNPLAHLDLFGFLLMMFAHIGWGKAVQINPSNFNSNKSRGFCEALVAFAGPLTNFIIALISCIFFVINPIILANTHFIDSSSFEILQFFIQLLITVNIGLGVFNLIPLPPLDGEKIFRNLLPYKVQYWLSSNYQTLYTLFLLLWFFGILEIIVSPVINVISSGMLYIVGFVIGLFI